MALTFNKAHTGVVGDHRVWHGSIAFDSSYPTSGEFVFPADVGFSTIYTIIPAQPSVASKRVAVSAFNTLTIWVEDGTSGIEAQAANASDQSGVVVWATIYGR